MPWGLKISPPIIKKSKSLHNALKGKHVANVLLQRRIYYHLANSPIQKCRPIWLPVIIKICSAVAVSCQPHQPSDKKVMNH
ncbi:hypothetical protein FGO68_gene16580 [Halteria grandinella]|uniref:Uncharacterized protein n=1 Tax=Halteria grandinella TaxID=5974 RepID=A0A8J8NUM0_HALGN|nr:hypothetical protein FGO68_gene16580 [Halteria grandinella]